MKEFSFAIIFCNYLDLVSSVAHQLLYIPLFCCFFFTETSSGRACLLLFSLYYLFTSKPIPASLALALTLGLDFVSQCILDRPGCRFLVLKLWYYLNQLHKLYIKSGCLFSWTLNSMEIRKRGKALCFVTLLCLWTFVSGALTSKGVNMEGN